MITRNGLIGIIVLLAGLTAGYFVSRALTGFHERIVSEFPGNSMKLVIPDPSLIRLSSNYLYSKDHFQEALNQSADALLKLNEGSFSPGEREIDLLSLLDYYRQFYLHYFRWGDTGNLQSSVQYKLALGQFKATLDYLEEKYKNDPFFTVLQLEEFRTFIRIAEQTARTIRWAKVVAVILIFLLLMGIPRLIRDSGFKKYAASLYYDSVFRPHFISDLNVWHSIRRMAFALMLFYLFSMVIFTSFASWKLPTIFGALGLIPVLMITALSGTRRRLPEILISLLAPKIVIVILVLGVFALRGPVFFWHRFWHSEIFRVIFLCFLFMLIFRKFHVTTILSRKWSHRNRRGAAAMVGMAVGVQVLTAGTLLYLFGPDKSLAVINSEVLVLPADFFGTGSLRIFWPMIAAGILTAGSFMLFIFNRIPGNEISRNSLT